MLHLMGNGYAVYATAATFNGYAIQFYLDRSGNYKIIGIDKDLNACKLISGTEWQFMISEKI